MGKEADNKIIPSLPFAKAYNFLLEDSNLTSAEKLVMIIICRYWPRPYWDTNKHVAEDLGFTERYIEKVIKSLKEKGYIKRGYAHTTKDARPHTVRVIVPKCFPVESNAKIKWVKLPEHMDGQHTEQTDGNCPNNSSFLPEQSGDLLERNKKEINKRSKKATLSPLPAKGQASALLETPKVKRLSPEEFEQRRQKLISDLRKSEKNKNNC